MWPTDLLQEEQLRGWLAGADPYRVQDCPLWILDSSPFGFPTPPPDGSNIATLWGYSAELLSLPEYSGAPTRVVQLPPGAGRGHGFCVLPSGHMVVATSEDTGGNARESWFLVPPNANGVLTAEQCPRIRCEQLFAGTVYQTHGASHVLHWGDGVVLIGNNGAWKPVTLAAWTMTNAELAALPGWAYNGNATVSGIADFDVARRPGTNQFVLQGHDRVWALNLGMPRGNLTGVTPWTHTSVTVPGGDGLDWIALGSNIGLPANQFWSGFIAFDSVGRLYKQRGYSPDIPWWHAATISGLPKLGGTAQANPPPDGLLTSSVFNSLPSNESMLSCIDFDRFGNLWVATNTTDRYTQLNLGQPAHLYRFNVAAVAAGGSQMPDRVITLPSSSQPWAMRFSPGHALVAR